MQERSEGTWLEAIALFETVRKGDQAASAQLLSTATEPDIVMLHLLRMLGVYLRGEDKDKLERFVAAARRAGPPPLPGPGARGPLSD